MRRTTMLWEVFVRRFEGVRAIREASVVEREAGELLCMSGRNFPPAVRSLLPWDYCGATQP
jgi:hypothetical protein